MVLSEVEDVGGFVGAAVSEPVLQGGILAAVFGYLLYLEPWLAVLSLLVFAPQFVFVPLLQAAINRRVKSRVLTMREVSDGIVRSAERRAQQRDPRRRSPSAAGTSCRAAWRSAPWWPSSPGSRS